MKNKEQWFQPTAETRGFQDKRVKRLYHLWKLVGELVFRLLRDPFNGLRVKWLRLFGATIGKQCYVSSKAIIVTPSNLSMGDNCCLDQYVYINGECKLANNVSLSSFVKLIAGGHDVRSRHFEYQDKVITICDSVFVGANSVVRGGVKINTFACIGANSFVIKDIPENTIAYGNPAQVVIERISQMEFEKYDFS